MRTESESAAFRTMQQSMILERLSLGMISDDEAAWELGCILPDGYIPLAGTHFRSGSSISSSVEAPLQNAGAQNQQLAKKSSPTAAGGGSK